MVMVMADEASRLEAVVARLIKDKLRQDGGLEDLLRAVREVEESFLTRVESGNEGGEPVRVDTAFAGEGTLKAETNVVVVPTMTATMTVLSPELAVIPDKTMDAIRSAIPELANEIRSRGPEDRTVVIELFVALINLLAALVTLYVALHPAASVTPRQITQFFDQSVHIVNQTTTVNRPTPHGRVKFA